MKSFREFILSEEKQDFNITIDIIKNFESSWRKEVANTARLLVDFYEGDDEQLKKSANFVFDLYAKAAEKAVGLLGKVPYFDKSDLIEQMLSNEYFPVKVDDLFPMSVYVSASPTDKATVGILIHANGKKEMFEGNDEASAETYDLVDKLLGQGDEEVKVWGSHERELVLNIKEKQELPKGLFVSPSRQYAAGYFDLEGDRVLFSCKIKKSYVRQESELDWKVKNNCQAKAVKIF